MLSKKTSYVAVTALWYIAEYFVDDSRILPLLLCHLVFNIIQITITTSKLIKCQANKEKV